MEGEELYSAKEAERILQRANKPPHGESHPATVADVGVIACSQEDCMLERILKPCFGTLRRERQG